MITLENLDDVFTFHEWSAKQKEYGQAIRSSAKELARSMIAQAHQSEIVPKIEGFQQAITVSDQAGPGIAHLTNLGLYARNRRKKAHEQVDVLKKMYLVGYHLPDMLSYINEIVMMANSAITFEAAAQRSVSLPERDERAESVQA